MTDTKAHWKRRALRAEEELESIRKAMQARSAFEVEVWRQNAALKTAFAEIEDAINSVVKGEQQ
jgi:succinate dehydrogenase/fumarate reductase flavoprotein subunit